MTERAAYIGRIRNLARSVAQSYLDEPRAARLPDGAEGLGRRGRSRSSQKKAGMMPHDAQPLLVELFVEELPPKALKALGEAFAAGIAQAACAHAAWLADDAAVHARTRRRGAWPCTSPTCAPRPAPTRACRRS